MGGGRLALGRGFLKPPPQRSHTGSYILHPTIALMQASTDAALGRSRQSVWRSEVFRNAWAAKVLQALSKHMVKENGALRFGITGADNQASSVSCQLPFASEMVMACSVLSMLVSLCVCVCVCACVCVCVRKNRAHRMSSSKCSPNREARLQREISGQHLIRRRPVLRHLQRRVQEVVAGSLWRRRRILPQCLSTLHTTAVCVDACHVLDEWSKA